ncbi:MAG: histidine phosphatase family protein [Muribaculaceae bacterium]|nr:histidine phosphatase family protein [Muribaculaceae bacterium]
MKRICITLLVFMSLLAMRAADPMATHYSIRQCEGSLTPYPAEVPPEEHPDSLAAVFINHVGRHGARYPSSAENCRLLQRALMHADSLGTITQTGRDLLRLTNRVISITAGRWGALDSLGMAEQEDIATRMIRNYPELFGGDATVEAISSYSPRAMMSMYSFTHRLDRLNNETTFRTLTGRVNSPLMRPFDTDPDYKEFRDDKVWEPVYDEYFESECPATAIMRALGSRYPFDDAAHVRKLAYAEWAVVAGCSAMSVEVDPLVYFTPEELNALWSCFNLRQYLRYSASTVSTVPADIASQLVLNLVQTTDAFVGGDAGTTVRLRFGHAETLMPLLSLLRLRGCYYLTNYFDTVAMHWRDFDIVPMAANLQLVLFRSRNTGHYYVRASLNEVPVPLLPNSDELYVPWATARDYMMRCLPLEMQ